MVDEAGSESSSPYESKKVSIDDTFGSVEIANPRKESPDISLKVNEVFDALQEKGTNIPRWIRQTFSDPDFYNALPENLRSDRHLFTSYIENSSKFDEIIHQERKKQKGEEGLLAEMVSIPASLHADGRERRAEQGQKLQLEYLYSKGIDPHKVLFFRRTQPSSTPKPEYYWTSDYWETAEGLGAEIFGEQRENSIILVSDLATINKNEGLIQDINDDGGMSVRQIGLGPFNQGESLAIIKPTY